MTRKRGVDIMRGMLAAVAGWVMVTTLAGCGGVDGKIMNEDDVPVYSQPQGNAASGVDQQETSKLTVLTPVTVECHLSVNGFGFYKVSFDGGSGYINDSTSILSDGGELSPDKVSGC